MNYYMGWKHPAPATIANYGLTLVDWKRMVRLQKGKCGICRRGPGETSRLVIDHEHVRGWKYMEPATKKKYVRGLLCDRENHWIVGKYATVELLRLSADYLERYQERKNVD